MKYWARNGSYDWICDTSEYAGYTGDVTLVNNTYLVTGFWNRFDGTRSPVNGELLPIVNGVQTKANGW